MKKESKFTLKSKKRKNQIDRLTRSIPSGNEIGANDLWLPGGFTSGGIVEVIVPQIPNTPEYVNIIFK